MPSIYISIFLFTSFSASLLKSYFVLICENQWTHFCSNKFKPNHSANFQFKPFFKLLSTFGKLTDRYHEHLPLFFLVDFRCWQLAMSWDRPEYEPVERCGEGWAGRGKANRREGGSEGINRDDSRQMKYRRSRWGPDSHQIEKLLFCFMGRIIRVLLSKFFFEANPPGICAGCVSCVWDRLVIYRKNWICLNEFNWKRGIEKKECK